MPTAGQKLQPVEPAPLAVFLDPPYREYEIHRRKLNQLLGSLSEKLPVGSVITVEAGRDLDGEVLPDFPIWDIRRYGDTQIAIRVLWEELREPSPAPRLPVQEEPAGDREEKADV